MAFTNLATQKILNGVQTHGDGAKLGDGFVFMKFAWEVSFAPAENAGAGTNSPATTDSIAADLAAGATIRDIALSALRSAIAPPAATLPATGEQGLDSAPSIVARTCELPRWSTDTQIVNVYNHKTLVQTKLTFEPITMTFYDQANGAIEKLLWTHAKGQFDGTDGSKKAGQSPLTITIKMKNLSGSGPDKTYKLSNAYITDAQHDTLDYSASDPVLWTITIRYEDLETQEFNGPTPVVTAKVPASPRKTPPPQKTPAIKPKPDAITTNETPPSQPSAWVRAGGAEIGPPGLGPAFGNPNLAIQGMRAQALRSGTFEWPWNKKATNAQSNIDPVSPSTGSRQIAVDRKIDQMLNFSPKWQQEKQAYLLANPPVTGTPDAVRTAIKNAEAAASKTVPKYTSFASPADSGVQTTVKENKTGEPSPPPVRDSAGIVNPKANDGRGQTLTNRQEEYQRNVEAAQRVNDALAADNAFKKGKLTQAQTQEYFKTGRVAGIKGGSATGGDKWDRNNYL